MFLRVLLCLKIYQIATTSYQFCVILMVPEKVFILFFLISFLFKTQKITSQGYVST